ncbi:MAG: hypothetical protein J5746_11425 [Victivallales bacterium]|nr:hypothetical protein [Victivallales bacterium]
MRIKYFLLSLILFFAAMAIAEPPEMKDMMLIVLTGQSNMAGRGIVEPEDKIPIPNVYTLDKENKWIPSVEPTHFDRVTAGTCLGRTFARKLHEKYPDRLIGIIPCAVGGSPIEVWKPGAVFKKKGYPDEHPYDDAIKRINIAKKNGRFVAVLWHQGCSNAQGKREFDVAKENYRKKLEALIARFRGDVPELANAPFIIGKLRSFRAGMKIDHVNQAIDEVVKNVKNTAAVSEEGLEPNADKLHYNRASLIMFGERYYKAFEDLCGKEEAKQGPDHECTSWLAFADLTKNNTHLLHKNRDAKARDIMVLISAKDTKYKWIGLGGAEPGKTDGWPCMGMNEAGLASVMNSGEKCTDNSGDQKAKTTPVILKEILSNCRTIDEALERLKLIAKNNEYSHKDAGSIFFFMDKEAAYIVEMTAHFITSQLFDHGYAYRANRWHNPGMAAYACSTVKSYLGSSNREYEVRTAMNNTLQNKGKFTVEDSMEMSRMYKMDDSPIDRRVCSKYTNSACTLEIDREYPAQLSTAYVTMGPPRNTIYVPVPICAIKVHEKMLSREWTQASWKRFDEKGDKAGEADIPQEWLDYENKSLAEYRNAKDKARALLKANKVKEAEALMQDAAMKIWDGAAKLLM